jgi:hypothetical protein
VAALPVAIILPEVRALLVEIMAGWENMIPVTKNHLLAAVVVVEQALLAAIQPFIVLVPMFT